jgi:hypothetical protein
MQSVILPSVIMLSTIMLSVITLSVIMLGVIRLSVVMLGAIMLNVVAPKIPPTFKCINERENKEIEVVKRGKKRKR